MTALLHDRGAFAVVFAHDNQRAARHTAGRKIGERIGGNVGADRHRLERHGTAQRVIDRGRERRRRRRLAGARFEMHAEFFENVVGVAEHVHQM